MNRTSNMILVCLWVLLPFVASAAPVGNIGDPILWSPGPLQKDGGPSIIATVDYDKQINKLPEQITRFPWASPDITPPEQRHYPQTRSSRNTLTLKGLKIGTPVSNAGIIYALVGASDSVVDFHYEDWTVTRDLASNHTFSRDFASNDTFSSGPDLYYGLGASIIMHRGEYLPDIPVTFGMDISYRRFSIEDTPSAILYYYSSLDEFQLAFCLSAETPSYSPYMGVKVASMTGEEEYINRNAVTKYYSEGSVHYKNNITWSKNIGYFAGVTTTIKGMISLGFEVRFGDENGMGVNVTTRF